ncbi:MAG: ADP-ribosylglycohydrolase family protein [Mycoplasma sp.]
MNKKEMAKRAILGFIYGDCLGVPYEFESRDRRKLDPCIGLTFGGCHDKPLGTWSDDTSMTLAVMDAFNSCMDTFYEGNVEKLCCSNFVRWYTRGAYTTDGDVFDAGVTTIKSIKKIMQGYEWYESGDYDYETNGNGALMRTLPAALKFANREAYPETILNIGAITHGHDLSKIICMFYTMIVDEIMSGTTDKYEIITNALTDVVKLTETFRQLDERFADMLSSGINNVLSSMSDKNIKSTGFVLDTIMAVVYCFLYTDNYMDSVLMAVNLGDDTDTIAAITGSISGMYYNDNIDFSKILMTENASNIIETFVNSFIW